MAPSPPQQQQPAHNRSAATKSLSDPREASRVLGLPRNATLDEINHVYKVKLADLQRKYSNQADKLVHEAEGLYHAYRSAYLSRDNAHESEMLPLTLSGPDSILNLFGVPTGAAELTGQSYKLHSSSQAQYRDGQLVRKESNRTESFINRDGKRETKVYENDRLIKHTIDGRDVLN